MREAHGGRLAPTALRLLAGSMVALALVALLVAGYLQWGTGLHTDRVQQRLTDELRRTDAAHPRPPRSEPPRRGEPVAEILIPALGAHYRYVIVEGTSTADLRDGPGHFRGSALPGRVGNFVVSGHRTTYGAPFNRLDELRRGDSIVIRADGHRYRYRVYATHVVAPDDIGVTYPVPGKRAAAPGRALITLTTCHPEYSAARRLVVHGELTSR